MIKVFHFANGNCLNVNRNVHFVFRKQIVYLAVTADTLILFVNLRYLSETMLFYYHICR